MVAAHSLGDVTTGARGDPRLHARPTPGRPIQTPPQRKERRMSEETTGLTRRDMLKVGGAVTLAGYAAGVDKRWRRRSD